MKESVIVLIPTCNRPKEAEQLSLAFQDYPQCVNVNNCNLSQYKNLDIPPYFMTFGKSGDNGYNSYFNAVSDLIDYVMVCLAVNIRLKYVLLLTDKVKVDRDIIPELVDTYGTIRNKGHNIGTLKPYYEPQIKKRYTDAKEDVFNFNGKFFIEQSWTDEIIFFKVDVLKYIYMALRQRTERVNSSGIGYSISQVLFENGFKMFTCMDSLIEFHNIESQLKKVEECERLL